MKEQLKMVEEFQRKQGNTVADPYTPLPRYNGEIFASLSPQLRFLRARLVVEEAAELAVALHQNDPVLILDAICDLLYVVYGTANALPKMALVLEEAFAEVHRSNMTKDIRGTVNDGDKAAVKGFTYSAPDLRKLLLEACVDK